MSVYLYICPSPFPDAGGAEYVGLVAKRVCLPNIRKQANTVPRYCRANPPAGRDSAFLKRVVLVNQQSG